MQQLKLRNCAMSSQFLIMNKVIACVADVSNLKDCLAI